MLNALRLPVDWSRIKQLIWLRGNPATGGGYYNWLEESGDTPLLLKNAYPHKMQKCVTNILPVQDLHGYDSPWPAGGGKNKFNIDAVSSITQSNGVITQNNNGTISVEYLGGSTAINCNKTLAELTSGLIVGETYTLSAESTGSGQVIYLASPAAQTWNFNSSKVLTQDMLDSKVCFYSATASTQVGQIGVISNMQIEQGSSFTTFAPYANICPISGWKTITAWDDAKYGGNIEWNQLCNQVNGNAGVYGIVRTGVNGDPKGLHYSGKSEQTTNYTATNNSSLIEGHIVVYDVGCDLPTGCRINFASEDRQRAAIVTIASSNKTFGVIITTGTEVDFIAYPMIYDLTMMFGAGNEPSTVEEFRALFPKDFYPYNAGTHTSVGEVNGSGYWKVPVTFGALGKNLFDVSKMPSLTTTAYYYPVKVGDGTFTLSTTAPQDDGNALVFLLAGNVTSGVSTGSNGVWSGQSRTVTAIDGYVTVAMRTRSSVDPSTYNTQLEAGSFATAFEPYTDTIYGGTIDLATGDGTIDTASVDLGTLTYSRTTSYANPFFYCTSPANVSSSGVILAEIYKALPKTGTSTFGSADNNSIAMSAPNPSQIYIRDDRYSVATEFKTAMNGVKLYYELATPIPFHIDGVAIKSLKGDNNVWTDCGNHMSVMYATSYPLETLTATGTSPLLLENSQDRKLVQCDVGIVATQSGSGDPYPPSGGANKWDEVWEAGRLSPTTGEPTENESGIRSKNFIPVVSGETYYIYCGTTVSNDFRILFYDADKTYLSASAWVYAGTTFSITGSYANVAYVKFFVTGGMYGNVYKNDIAINLPSSVTTYSPYSNIRHIHGVSTLTTTVADNSAGTGGTTYSTEFGCMGKNLLNPDKRTTDQGGNRIRWYYNDGFMLKANQPYTFSVSGTTQTIALYIINKSTVTDVAYGNTPLKYTPTEDVIVYFQAYRGEPILDANNFQLELGSSASSYQPYTNECYGGTFNELTGGLGQNMEVVDLGALTWSGYHGFFYAPVENIKKVTASTVANIVCEAYKAVKYNDVYNNDAIGIAHYASQSRIAIYDPNIANASAMNTVLSGIKAIYEVENIVPRQYDPHAIKSLAGHTYVLSNGGGDVTVQYKGITPEN